MGAPTGTERQGRVYFCVPVALTTSPTHSVHRPTPANPTAAFQAATSPCPGVWTPDERDVPPLYSPQHDRPHADPPSRRPGAACRRTCELVHDLLARLEPVSTDDADQVANAWKRELERRGREIQNGHMTGVGWSTVRERLRSELADG